MIVVENMQLLLVFQLNFAGKLIEDCSLKGMKHGGAMISDKHANFIVNYKDATSSYSKFNLKMLDNNSNITELTSGFYDYGNQTGTTFTSMSMFKVYNNNVYYEIYNR